MQNADLNDPRIIRIRSGSDPILIRIVNFNPIRSADHEFAIRSGSDPNPIRGFESDRIFCGTLIAGQQELNKRISKIEETLNNNNIIIIIIIILTLII